LSFLIICIVDKKVKSLNWSRALKTDPEEAIEIGLFALGIEKSPDEPGGIVVPAVAAWGATARPPGIAAVGPALLDKSALRAYLKSA